jgi:hypothetical protein
MSAIAVLSWSSCAPSFFGCRELRLGFERQRFKLELRCGGISGLRLYSGSIPVAWMKRPEGRGFERPFTRT